MLRLGEDAVYGPNLNDRAEVHDRNAVGEVAHHIKVVADKHVGEAVLLAEVRKKVENLALNRYVECGDRLIEHDKLWVECERSRNAHALSLATREFVWVTDRILRREADQLKRLVHALAALRGVSDVVR